jgi:protease I
MKFLTLTGDAGEGLEIYYLHFRVQESGHVSHIAASSKRPVGSVVHDFEPGFDAFTEKAGYRVPVDVTFAQVDPTSYDVLLLPGGRAPAYIRNNPKVQAIVHHFVREDKPIGSICHGVQVLMAADAIRGRSVATYPELATDIERAGGTFVDAEVVLDGNIVSSRAWPDLPAFTREVFRLAASRQLEAVGAAGKRSPTSRAKSKD